MRTYLVYMHVTPNGKKYIGITCSTTEKRWKNGKGYKDSPLFFNAINRYGWDNIEHLILFKNLSASQAKSKEKELIKEYCTNERRYGYNLTLGGDGAEGYRHNKEAIEKMKRNHADVSGNKNPMYGVRLPGELSPSYGRKLSQETKNKISKANKGRKLSDKQRKILSEANTGENNYSYGRTGAKSAVARKVIQLNIEGKVIRTWDCISEASRQLGLKNQSIVRCCRGGRKSTGGYEWQYADV